MALARPPDAQVLPQVAIGRILEYQGKVAVVVAAPEKAAVEVRRRGSESHSTVLDDIWMRLERAEESDLFLKCPHYVISHPILWDFNSNFLPLHKNK